MWIKANQALCSVWGCLEMLPGILFLMLQKLFSYMGRPWSTIGDLSLVLMSIPL